jgi:hypothetical protein
VLPDAVLQANNVVGDIACKKWICSSEQYFPKDKWSHGGMNVLGLAQLSSLVFFSLEAF